MPLSFFAATLLLSSCTPVAVEDLPMAAATPARSLKEIGNADAVPADPDGSYPIDLPTALRLAAGRNLDLARAVERTRLAAARSDQAQLSIVPDLQSGASFGRKNGLLQDIAGAPIQTQRVDRSAGLGASTGLPGVSVDLGLSDAIFNPLAAKQDQKAALASSRAREHQVLAATAIAYFELVRAHGHLQLAREIEAASRKLADDTTAYGTGWVFVAQQFLSADVGVWFQAAGADASVADEATGEIALGLTGHDAFGRRGDGWGVAFGRSNPLAEGERMQNTIEAYYRLQVTGALQVTFDVQALVPPAGSAGEESVFAGAIRAKWTF